MRAVVEMSVVVDIGLGWNGNESQDSFKDRAFRDKDLDGTKEIFIHLPHPSP
jgi:hypothetical protein